MINYNYIYLHNFHYMTVYQNNYKLNRNKFIHKYYIITIKL